MKGAASILLVRFLPGSDATSLLQGLTDDCRRAWFAAGKGPGDPVGRSAILNALKRGGRTLPGEQGEALVEPLEKWIRAQDEAAFATFLKGDPEGETGAFMDLVQTVYQRARAYEPDATPAFQEIVSDLYDGYLSAQDRRGVRVKPDSTLPPLVRWGNPDDGPYTWPVETLETFGVKTGVVNMPPACAHEGLAAWASLNHETCGHDVLNAYPGLLPEPRRVVSDALEHARVPDVLTEHWMRGFEEAASDVMGVLNLGPTAALADVAFFRGCYRKGTRPSVNMREDPKDEHPIDLLRIYLDASVVRGLRFAGADEWSGRVEREARQDARGGVLRLGRRAVPLAEGRASAAVFARAMTSTRLESLDHLALGGIQNWRDQDQAIAERLAKRLLQKPSGRVATRADEFAAHVLAGTLHAAMEHPKRIPQLFLRFRSTLAHMNARNPAWRPDAMIRHRGDVAKHHLHAK